MEKAKYSDLQKHNKAMGRLEKTMLVLVGIVIASLFTASVFISIRTHQPAAVHEPAPHKIERYARLFLEGSVNEQAGRMLDCSAFTQTVFKHFTVQLPPTAFQQYKACIPVKRPQLSCGNLVFFITTAKRVSHVGIYLGNNQFIHSPDINKEVRIDSLTNSYYIKNFYSGGRITFTKNTFK